MLESLNRRNSIDSNQDDNDNDNDNDNHSNDELSPSELYYSPSGLPPKSQLLLRNHLHHHLILQLNLIYLIFIVIYDLMIVNHRHNHRRNNNLLYHHHHHHRHLQILNLPQLRIFLKLLRFNKSSDNIDESRSIVLNNGGFPMSDSTTVTSTLSTDTALNEGNQFNEVKFTPY